MKRWTATILGACAVLLASCATVEKDVKAVADVCRPELMPDVEQAMPYVVTLAVCEATGGNCASALADLKSIGTADARACAVAELHAGTVKLANPDGGAP